LNPSTATELKESSQLLSRTALEQKLDHLAALVDQL
jgi:hypothetical protein